MKERERELASAVDKLKKDNKKAIKQLFFILNWWKFLMTGTSCSCRADDGKTMGTTFVSDATAAAVE